MTILFADIKDSVRLVKGRDPEEAQKILDPILKVMMDAVHRYEGTVNHILGDGIMALFGAPLTHEDHAVRACYAALAMQQELRHYADEIAPSKRLPQIRIGLNSGEVVVRAIDNDLNFDYLAVGDSIHLAARMQELAAPGAILMTARTLREVDGSVQVKSLGLLQAKGFARMIESYELTEELASTVIKSANILLQTVIIPSDQTDEGLLIQAVAFPWFDIVELLAKDPSVAYQLSARHWEEIIAGAYKRAKFDEVILTPRSGDYGRDVIAIKKGLGSVRIIDQVKAYKPDHLVTANDVRALMGVLHADGASKGFVTTTSDFAPKLKVDPFISSLIPSRLGLINGPMLFQRLRDLKKN